MDHQRIDDQKLPQDEDVFKQVLSLLRIRKGTDFTYYKQTTIRRRILRRMALNKNEELFSYLKYLRENKPEQDILYQDLLIPVTSFFRDTRSFEYLSETVFPGILKNKTENEPIRLWVAGCSTGEEAYSMAICLKELMGTNNENVQIFATDISEPAIAKARAGIYSKSEVDSITAQRVSNYFIETNGSYHVNKHVREMCVFAVHNFLKDPPFGKMDFISCRNVLIYLEPYLQKKALTTFHYSLNPNGFLFLGKSETTSQVTELFAPIVKNDKLFVRKNVSGKFMHVASQRSEQNLSYPDGVSKNESARIDFQKTADDIVLNKYTPAGVIVNEFLDIVHFRGSTGSFLEQTSGKPNHNIIKMARHGLAFDLRNILHKAKKEKSVVIKENILLHINDKLSNISIEAIPLSNTIEPHYLVLFHEHFSIPDQSSAAKTGKKTAVLKRKNDKDIRILQLENELAQTHEDMRSITEDQEAANEELQTDNEDLLSRSEELQSLNEELETSKEELQSTNEELMVVNQEIITLNEQVKETRDYAEAIISTMRQPLLVLDKNLRVKTGNMAYYQTFRMNPSETEGKLVYEVDNKNWDIPALRKLLETILPEKTAFMDFEITHTFPSIGERILLLNAREMSREKEDEKLILLAIEDITEVRMKTLELQRKEKELLNKDISERKIEKVKLEQAVEERTRDLEKVNKKLVFQNEEKEKRAAELRIANKELAYQNAEKEKRAAELYIANKELAFQNEEKEKRAAELILANLELKHQNEEKEKRAAELIIINKELHSFAYISSHDLQEPLRKIRTFADRILERENINLTETGKEYLKRMQSSAALMQQLIEDLLAFSRINTADRKFKSTDLRIILEEVKVQLSELIAEKQANIDSSGLGEVTVIPFQFRQLIYNMVTNSLKYSKADPVPNIIIRSKMGKHSELQTENPVLARRINTEEDYFHIHIADNGIGFDPQFKDHIFEVFKKLHRKEEYAGTGIGLAIVKKIVENHNGVIIANGEQDKGASFDIYIPAL
jgi:two-component system CheB/CheR fusion protein